MTAIKTFTAAAAAALTLAAAGVASAQTPYSAAPYSPQSQQPSQGGQVLETILGALFGQGQTSLDSEWSRGRRPLYNQRAAFESQLDARVRDGSLAYSHATGLRADYADLVGLETRYAADGRFTTNERSDMTERYRNLTRHLEADTGGDDDGYDDDHGSRDRLADQGAEFDARVAAALRARDITRTEANRLRTDFQALVRLEAQYERDGLSDRERQDLEARYADLNRRVGDDYVPGNGGGDSGGVYGDPHAMQIEARIAAGLRNGSISRADAARYREELRDLSRRWADLEARVSVRR